MTNRRLPPFRALQVFDAAARKLSFTRAADELFVTPSAISHQIKELETFLGEALFIRNGRDIKLSKLGSQYNQEIQAALNLVASATRSVVGERTTTIRLAVFGAFAQKCLIKNMGDFYKSHPEIDLQVIMMSSDPELSDRTADVFITSNPSKRGYETTLILDESFVPVCHPDILQGMAPNILDPDIWRLPIITNQNDPLGSDWLDWASAAELTLPLLLTMKFRYFSHQMLAIEATLMGLGVALCNSWFIKDELESGQLISLDPSPPLSTGLNYYLCIKQSRLKEDALQKFCRWIKKI
jgi:LysR family glycine cleavage system transcriptional activator